MSKLSRVSKLKVMQSNKTCQNCEKFWHQLQTKCKMENKCLKHLQEHHTHAADVQPGPTTGAHSPTMLVCAQQPAAAGTTHWQQNLKTSTPLLIMQQGRSERKTPKQSNS
jgi:hypothetical protein